jgi:HSP20 family molecular chaperone IbpA
MNTQTNVDKQGARGPEKMQQRPTLTPTVDIYENNDEVLILADLPGVAKADLAVHLEKGKLTIDGKRPPGGEPGAEAFDYRRTFAVPQGIDAEKIVAGLTGGVLRLHLPKSAALKPRQIEIKAG